MRPSRIFDKSLAQLGLQKSAAGTSPEALAKDLYAAADILYDVRASVRAVTTDGLSDAKEGYAFRLGPIPSGNQAALELVKDLLDTSMLWDVVIGQITSDLEWLGKTLSKFPKTKTAAVKMIRFQTRSLGEGVTTEAFVKALEECSEVLLGNMRETRAVIKTVVAESKNPMGLFQHNDVLVGAKDLLGRKDIWETRTKNLANGCKALAAALKSKTASKIALYEWALTKLARMTSANEDTKRSRFEEGKPADPTENMDREDAAEWKRQNEKNKDNFKTAAKADVDLLTDLKTALKEKDSSQLQSSLKGVPALRAVQHVIEAMISTATKLTEARDLLGGRLSLKAAAKADVDLLTDLKTALKEKDAALFQSRLKSVPALRAVQHVIEAMITTATKPTVARDLLGGRLSLKAAFDEALVKLGAAKPKTSAIGYSDEELAVLALIISLKPGYRAREFEEAKLGPYNKDNPHIKSLVEKGLLKIDTRGAISAVKSKAEAVLKGEYVPEKYRYNIANPGLYFKRKEV